MPSHPHACTSNSVFDAYNCAEEIDLVRNQGLQVDDDMETAPENITSVGTYAAETLFEVQAWGWDGIDFRAVVSQNQNEPSF